MLTEYTISKINDQIKRELSTVDSFVSDDDEKMAALDRIAKLTALLYPQPSREAILAEVANAIIVEARKEDGKSIREICADLATAVLR